MKLISDLSTEYDLITLRSNPHGMFRTLFSGSTEHQIADDQVDSFYSSVDITQPELPRLVLPEDGLLSTDNPAGEST